jgi:hypothetical protein
LTPKKKETFIKFPHLVFCHFGLYKTWKVPRLDTCV